MYKSQLVLITLYTVTSRHGGGLKIAILLDGDNLPHELSYFETLYTGSQTEGPRALFEAAELNPCFPENRDMCLGTIHNMISAICVVFL